MHELSLLYTRDSLGDTFRFIGKETFQQMHFCKILYLFSLGGVGEGGGGKGNLPPRVGDKAVTARQECCAPREPLRHEARGTRHGRAPRTQE